MSTETHYRAYKRLELNFDKEELLVDLKNTTSLEWVKHVNARAYSGEWDVLPLRCSTEHIDSHPILQSFALEAVKSWQNLPLLNRCFAFKNVFDALESYQCEIYSMRLMRLHAGAEIAEHRDHGVGHESGEVRLHVPITTNPGVEFLVNHESVPMQPGELWYINADLPHSVANRGESDRIHLLIDGKVNDWLGNQLNP